MTQEQEVVLDEKAIMAIAYKAYSDAYAGGSTPKTPSGFEAAIRAVIAALSIVSKPSEEGWRPIETAPKDGSWFLICRDEDGFDGYEIGSHDPMTLPEYVPVEGGLYQKVDRQVFEWRGFNNFHRATHWRPLPAPPVQP